MPPIDVLKPGSFCWIELATTDQPAAKAFYQELFGWTMVDVPIGRDDFYTFFKLHDRDTGAGCTLRPEQRQLGIPPHWNLYIAVVDVDSSANKALELGANVLSPPFDVGGAGRMALVKDPTGAPFCLWQPNSQTATLVNNEEGAFCWADLMTSDRDRAAGFYAALFGWKIEKEDENSVHGYYHIKNGEDYIGGMQATEKTDPNITSHWQIYFQAEDCETKTAEAKSLGASVYLSNVRVENVGRLSVITDPQGAVFSIFQTMRQR